jgi:hypothetical protein
MTTPDERFGRCHYFKDTKNYGTQCLWMPAYEKAPPWLIDHDAIIDHQDCAGCHAFTPIITAIETDIPI